MGKEYLFKNRVIVENKVFLLAEDVAKKIGYDSLENFTNAFPELIVEKNGLPKLVEETKYNNIILNDVEISDRIKHLEYTRVDTLRSRAETLRSFYPLKFMLVGKILELKASDAGYESVEKYINEVEYPEELEEEKEELIRKADLNSSIENTKKKINDLVDYDILKKYNIKLIQYMHINEHGLHVESFLAGKGIFFALYDSDYAFDELKVIDGDLIIPTYDDDEDSFIEKNYGHDISDRDYSQYSCIENLLYLISHKEFEDVGVDLMHCHQPGIDFYISQIEMIKILSPSQYSNIILIDGVEDFEFSKHITPIDNK